MQPTESTPMDDRDLLRQGTPETIIARLRDYIDPVDPTFFKATSGATTELIEHYCTLAGLRSIDVLPPSYREFLRVMGTRDAGLFVDIQLKTSISWLVEIYEDWMVSQPDTFGPELPIVATYIIGDQLSLDLRQVSA